MHRNSSGLSKVCIILGLLVFQQMAPASASSPGWHTIPDTQLRRVCAADNGYAQIAGSTGCPAITLAWNSAVLDTTRNRLIIWGGGHNDYYGNEVYAFDLASQVIERLTNPGLPPGSGSSCQEAIANGSQPNSRHTYDGIEYVPSVDKMFVFGGSLSCGSGAFSNGTWLFDFRSNSWEVKNPSGQIPRAVPGVLTAYDGNTGNVLVYDGLYLYAYDPGSDHYTQLSTSQQPVGYHLNATIDPVKKKFVIIGYDNVQGAGKVWAIDISPGSSYKLQEVVTTGGESLIRAIYPGVDYDSVAKKIVAWSYNTPNVVYSLDLDSGRWETATYAGGPVPVGNGTHGRWRYSPASDVFVLANRVDDNIVLLYKSSSGQTSDTTPPSAPGTLTANALSGSQVRLEWSASTDNVAVVNYRVYRCASAGCAPTSVVGSSSGTSFLDEGLGAGTSYTYAVAATDAAGNLSAPSPRQSVVTQSGSVGGGAAENDFASRCNSAGVVACVGFDNESSDVVRGVNLWPDSKGNYQAGLDTIVRASGTGSLRFDLPPPPHAGPNISGSWSPQSKPLFGRTFSENSTFYVQYRMRLSPEMVVSSWQNATWKTSIFHYGNKTCGAIELTTSNYYGSPLAQMNTDCGARGMWTTLDGSYPTTSTPMLMQQGDFMNCAYGSSYSQNCLNYVANEWLTMYYKIQIGTWDQPNSSVEAWMARPGDKAFRQFIRVPNLKLSCNGDPCNVSPYKDQGYNNVTLLPYMTGLSSSIGPSTTAHMWFDELIVSTAPIALPGGVAAPPEPPSAFRAE